MELKNMCKEKNSKRVMFPGDFNNLYMKLHEILYFFSIKKGKAMKKKIATALLISIFLSCSQTTNIKEIKQNPRKYFNKKVTVEGVVTNTFSLFLINYFEIKDKTDSIIVITSKPLPEKGEIVKITGRFEYYALGTKRIKAIIEAVEDEKNVEN
jgi:hypothetical protein